MSPTLHWLLFTSAILKSQLGSMAGLTALTIGIGQEKANKENGAVLKGNGTGLKSEL